MIEKKVGKFELRAWTEGFPVTIDLSHEEPNGETKCLRLLGAEELEDLRFAIERVIELAKAESHLTRTIQLSTTERLTPPTKSAIRR